MHPALKLIVWTIAPLVFSLPISVVMGDQDGGAMDFAQANANAQETKSEKKAEGDRLLKQGIQQYRKGNFREALQIFQKVLLIRREIKDRIGEGVTLNNIGSTYARLGRSSLPQVSKKAEKYYQQAQENHQKSLAIAREVGNRQGESVALFNLGKLYMKVVGDKGQSKEQVSLAFQSYGQALAIAREVNNPELESYIILEIASLYEFSLEDSSQAVETYQQLEKVEKRLVKHPKNKDDWLEVGFFDNFDQELPIPQYQKVENLESYSWGKRTLRRGFLSIALRYFYDVLTIARANNDRLGESIALRELGVVYYSLENYTHALGYYQLSLIIQKEIGVLGEEFTTLNVMGLAYESIGQYSQSLAAYNQVLAGKMDDPSLEGIVLNNIGRVYESLGKYAQALEAYQKALDLHRQVENGLMETTTLINIASVHNNLKEYSLALRILESLTRKIGSEAVLAQRFDNYLGMAFLGMGNYQEALNVFREVENLPLYDEFPDTPPRDIDRRWSGIKRFNIGLTYEYMRQYHRSVERYQQALKIFREVGDRANEGETLSNLGRVLLKNGKIVDAEQYALNSIAIWESLRPGLTDDQRRSLFETQANTYRTLQQVQIALQKIEPALETSDRGRARAFIELLAARFAGETLENAIAKQKVEKLSIAQIQQVAKTQTATLVQYSIVSDKDLYIYIIQPNGSVSFRKADISILGKSLSNFVNASRDGIGVRGRTEEAEILTAISPEKQRELQEKRNRSLRQLHQLLIEPIADLLPKNENERVIFMPQGELFLVPFPALLNAQNQPLITQHTILTAPSIQTLDLTHKTAQNRFRVSRPALVIGNPMMPAVTTVIGNPPQKLTPLPGSEIEANAIAQQLNTQAMTGANARKDTVIQKMQNAGIIHLATHGLLDSFKGDTPGAIALAPTGTNQPNDGLLTSGEIFDLKLNADLVVLSACDTGRGDITGDGVIGLSRSLFVAGVPSVIVSLWKVPDESTAFLMTEFYRNWKDRKLDKAQSLRQAMLTTRDKYPQPLHWAAFTLIGESE